jgi:predicted DCC family thiol-disulfide oxidoreductase YuxK
VASLTNRVARPPSKPLLVYDADCAFCKLWIARWREETGDAVDYEPLQNAAANFPELPRAEFERAVKVIEPDGRVYSGAEAVLRSLGAGGGVAPTRWCYDHVPGFAAIAEAIYRLIASHRGLAHRVTGLLWGNDVRRPTYFVARDWFLRALGVIYLIAFLSFWVQCDGLIGARGIAPMADYLFAAHAQLGTHAYSELPTLCWLDSSNAFLHFLCGAGAVFSVLLVIGVAPAICLVLLFASYLSLTIAGQEFLSFQWDILLLECGFLAIFLAPFGRIKRRARLSPAAIFLLQCLLFKLMFMSGIVKLTSGDDSWANLTALDYHYWTQPLPTVLGWWADKSPEWFKHFSTAAALAIEIGGPLLIWFPRRLRLLGAGAMIFLQICIGLTGNYAFFNLLTIALCLFAIDDRSWPFSRLTNSPNESARRRGWEVIPILVLAAMFPINAMLIVDSFKPRVAWPRPIAAISNALAPFRIVDGYGLFRVMTKERAEIVIEGSADGIDWKPYVFKWKPGPLDRMPAFVEPHQPRLDWQMWFAALGNARQNPWFFGLVQRLLEGEPVVRQLLASDPFPESAPRYLRAEIYHYRFATVAEHRQTGAWWVRGDALTYLPEVSLRGD